MNITEDIISGKIPLDKEQLRYMVKEYMDVTQVNTSEITDMSCMFLLAFEFNQDIGHWNTSNAGVEKFLATAQECIDESECEDEG